MNKLNLTEQCIKLMIMYKEHFGKNIPCYVMFKDMESIKEIMKNAIDNDEELNYEE